MTEHSDFDRRMLEQWAATAQDKTLDMLVDEFSLFVARSFLNGTLCFWDADEALNQVMAALNFEAPLLFWEVYTAFEDFEVFDNPDEEAVAKIKELVTKKAG